MGVSRRANWAGEDLSDGLWPLNRLYMDTAVYEGWWCGGCVGGGVVAVSVVVW